MTNNLVSLKTKYFGRVTNTEFKLTPALEVENTSRVEYLVVSNLTKSNIIFNFKFTSLLGHEGTFEGKEELKPYEKLNILSNKNGNGSEFPILMEDGSNLRFWTDDYNQHASVALEYRIYYEDTDVQGNLNDIHASLKSLTQSHSDLQSRVATLGTSHEELSNSHGELNSLVQNDLINYINEQYTSIYDTFNAYANQLVDEVKQDLTSFKKEINDKSDSIIKRIDEFYNDISEYVGSNEEDKQYNIKQPLEELQTQFEEWKKYIEEMISNTNGNIDIKLEDALNQFNIISKSAQLKVIKDNQYLYELDFIDKDNVIKPEEPEVIPETNNGTTK